MNNINKYKKIVLSIVVLSAILISSQPAFAAVQRSFIKTEDFNDFAVEPGKTEIILNPGEHVIKQITITNRINKTANFVLTAEDLVGTDDSQQPVRLLGNEKGPYSIKDFIKPEITTFSLKFGEQITIPVDISVPINVEPRGYYGALIVTNNPDVGPDGNPVEVQGNTRLVSRIGSIMLVKINGEGIQEATLANFKTIGPKKLVYTKLPEGFEVALKNTGTVHLVPYGTVTIKNIFGRTIDILPINAYFSLPDATRYIEIPWDKEFGFGRYTAFLNLNKGYNNEYVEAKIAFWVLPWKILAMVFLIIVIITTSVYYIVTRFEFRRKK